MLRLHNERFQTLDKTKTYLPTYLTFRISAFSQSKATIQQSNVFVIRSECKVSSSLDELRVYTEYGDDRSFGFGFDLVHVM